MTRSRDVSAVQNNLGVAIPPAAAGKNAVINGGFDIWQRGTSFAASAATNQYSADRWQIYRGVAGSTFSRQTASSLGTTPSQVIQYCMRVARDSGNTSTGTMYLMYSMETADSLPYMGKTVTLSFYARAGANFSSASSLLGAAIVTGTGTDQNQLAFTGYAVNTSSNSTLTTSWQRFTLTATLGTSPTELGIRFYYDPVGTAGAADYFEITGVQLELGSSATPFSRAGGSIGGELALCQRYFNRLVTGDLNAAATLQAISTTGAIGTRSYPPMRTAPAITVANVAYFNLRNATNTLLTTNGFAAYNICNTAFSLYLTVASGLVAGNATEAYSNNANATLDLNSEI